VRRRSVGYPLALGITLAVVAAALAVGWQLLVVFNLEPVKPGLTPLHWTLVILGSMFFLLLIVGLLLLCIWLVREMRFNQRQEAFLDAVTHEMKTPLASLRLYLETLARHDLPPDRQASFLERMSQDIERLEETVKQVLVVARTDDHGKAKFKLVDMQDLLEECIHELRELHSLPAEAVTLDQCETAFAWGNREELGVVFRNLIGNSLKYSPNPETVRISLSALDKELVRIQVSDRGIGLTRSELRKVFRRFYRVGRDVHQVAGLGLGLFIVRQLVKRHDGSIRAESKGHGEGSVFTVTLPSAKKRRRLEESHGAVVEN
jgi:signal transduction histidine kinase|tara:strand:- start:4328 stop:5284 length:957 start_codon:yes stop_codon:yes gene_type:complete